MGEGKGKGDRGGFGKGKGKGKGKRKGRGDDSKEWVPVTKLGRLVKEGKISCLEEIYLFSLAVKEHQIIDHFIPEGTLKDEVMKIMPVQKQTTAGQRTRFKAFVAVGDEKGHVGLGFKSASEVATAIRGAIIMAKITLVPIRRGYWGKNVGLPHTIPCKVTGKCGSVRVRLIPAPRGTGLVAAPVPKKLLNMAGVEDCYTSSSGHTRTLGNFVKAVFAALGKTYGYLSPDLWPEEALKNTPYQEHTDFLAKSHVEN
jgi:small subunit ribosomal protein S2e